MINGVAGMDIKMIANVFWKVDGTYVIPEYKPDEVIRVVIYENRTNTLIDRSFYMADGIELRVENLT